jgi:hypothetical protein
LEYVLFDIQRKFEKQVIALIKVMQEELGYVSFKGTNDLPDFCLFGEDHFGIVAIKVVCEDDLDRIYVILDTNFDDSFDKGWERVPYNQNIDMYSLFDCLKDIVESN